MLGSWPSFYFDVGHYYARLRPPTVVKMVVVIWAEIWYNIGRQMRLQEERVKREPDGEVVDTTSGLWHREKLPRWGKRSCDMIQYEQRIKCRGRINRMWSL